MILEIDQIINLFTVATMMLGAAFTGRIISYKDLREELKNERELRVAFEKQITDLRHQLTAAQAMIFELMRKQK